MTETHTVHMVGLDYEKSLKLTVIIPCYNEVKTVEKVLERVLQVEHADEVIIVD